LHAIYLQLLESRQRTHDIGVRVAWGARSVDIPLSGGAPWNGRCGHRFGDRNHRLSGPELFRPGLRLYNQDCSCVMTTERVARKSLFTVKLLLVVAASFAGTSVAQTS